MEWTFAAGGGIVSHTPRAASGHIFRSSTCIGTTRLTLREVEALIGRLRPAWHGTSYDALRNNCNHFSDALCRELVGWGLPGYVNRIAGVGAALVCLLPSSIASRLLSASDGGAGATSTAANSRAAGSDGSPDLVASAGAGRPFVGEGHALGAAAPAPAAAGWLGVGRWPANGNSGSGGAVTSQAPAAVTAAAARRRVEAPPTTPATEPHI